ncbi:MAG: Ig-like domain repeat protein, partial [Methanomassiliicoccales archaeon]
GWTAGPTGISSQAPGLPTALISPGSAVALLTYVGYTAPNWEQSLNATGLSFSSGGLVPWISVPYGSRSDAYCIQSGIIGDRDSSWLKLTLKQTGLLTFYWKISSKAQGDTLSLRMDGESITQINGSVEWTKVSLIVQAAEHTITWTYQKDASGTSGEDAGFLDDLVWSPGKVIGEQDFEGGAGPAWTVGDLNESNGLDYWGTEPYLDEYQGHIGWCAAVGVNSGNYPGYDNSYTHYYDMGMESYLDFRLPAGKSYQYLAVDFLYHGSVLAINGRMVDYLYFEAHNASGWSRSWIMPSYTPYPNVIQIIGWHYVFVPISNDVDEVRLVFHSGDTLWDSFGMWIDEVRVIGYSESMGDVQDPVSQVLDQGTYTNSTQLSVPYAANDDGGSGIDYVELYCRAPGQTTYFRVTTNAVPNGRFTASPIDMTLSGTDGLYQFYTVAVDKAGNMEATSVHADSSITLDREAPTISLLLNDAVPKAWYNAISVALSATDPVSGVNRLIYSIEGGSWQEFTTNISLSMPGRYPVQYRSQDGAGNWGPSFAISFSIENVTPLTTSAISGEQNSDGWCNGNATLTLSATDFDSGVGVTMFRMDDGAWQTYAGRIPMAADGSHVIEFYSIDAAGNRESTRSASFKVDHEAPVTSIVLTGNQISVGLYNDSVAVSLTSSDAESGVNNTYYRIDSGTWTHYLAPFSVSTEGAHSVQYYAVDRAGNSEAIRSDHLIIDLAGSGNVPGQVTGAGDQTLILGLIAIAALAVVGVTVMAMRHRKH